jgi:GTP-binding protein YchF
MSLKCAIVGLPNVGKSTIFNALTNSKVSCENYPFCTIEPNIASVAVRDQRLYEIDKFINSDKIIPTTVNFVDIAGLVKGASKGEGLGNKFLSNIRECDAIIHVVRCFENKDITHVNNEINPIKDIEIIETELIYADYNIVEKALEKYTKISKGGSKSFIKIIDLLENLLKHLEKLLPARMFFKNKDIVFENKEVDLIFKNLNLITAKPLIFLGNRGESAKENYIFQLKEYAKKLDIKLVFLTGIFEFELSQLEGSEKKELLKELEIKETGLDILVKESYDLLNLQTFFTAGKKEIKAWTINKGSNAFEAAGKIHSDFQKGFIRAEIYEIKDLLKYKNKLNIKENGKIRLEGKDYILNDGDIVEFRFNV